MEEINKIISGGCRKDEGNRLSKHHRKKFQILFVKTDMSPD